MTRWFISRLLQIHNNFSHVIKWVKLCYMLPNDFTAVKWSIVGNKQAEMSTGWGLNTFRPQLNDTHLSIDKRNPTLQFLYAITAVMDVFYSVLESNKICVAQI